MAILEEHDATEQAELVRRGSVSPAELVEATISRIEASDPCFNAVPIKLFDEARSAATSPRLPNGPFRGVPLLLKDALAMQAGQPLYQGNRALRDADYRAPTDSPLGARFREAGFLTLGKTNMAELGLQTTTQPLAFGPTRNPWAPDRSAGGSSGGAAAAVASGMVPLAHAVDGGGSIRIPAGWCGLVGLKVSRGRISAGPESISPLPAEGVLSRTVRDTAAVLDAVHGALPGDLFVAPAPKRRYTDELDIEPGSLRIGLLTTSPLGLHPECVTAVEGAGRSLESLGHIVEQSSPESLFEPLPIEYAQILSLSAARESLAQLAGCLGRPVSREDVEPYTWAAARWDRPAIEFQDYLEAQRWQSGWAWRVIAWWGESHDLLVTPTASEPPPTLEELTPSADRPWDLSKRIMSHSAFTRPFNTTGQPAISLPLHWTSGGLPVGVQLVAAPGREDMLIRVAAQLERARPWRDRRPAESPK